MTGSADLCKKHWGKIREFYRIPSALFRFSESYRRWLGRYFRFYIPQGVRLLEVGCGAGHLLELLPNRQRSGLDLVPEQLDLARQRLPDCTFLEGAAETIRFVEKYDYLVISDTLNEAADVQELLRNLHGAADPATRLIISSHNNLWQPLLGLATLLRLKPKRPHQNWLSRSDILNLLELSGWELVRYECRILIPHELWGFGTLVNRLLAPFCSWLCLVLFFIARPRPVPGRATETSVSVIVPARNEAGNIPAVVNRIPRMGKWTEIVFVEGNSSDQTWATIQEAIRANPGKEIRAYQQSGKGKADAMRLGYEQARGDILMILDADLSVPPEDLDKFFEVLVQGLAEFANGVRLVYPMEDKAMRFLNMGGNKFFSLLFSWLLHIPIKDTLCGTKAFRKADYQAISENRSYFGDFDPFGDFDLIFGAAKLNLRLRDIPIRYRNRTYGKPQINRWRDGILLFRMSWFAARKLKFF